ncbi:MAG: TIGR02281 family clan AA aspartic protease [Pseudomonadota bacterium]
MLWPIAFVCAVIFCGLVVTGALAEFNALTQLLVAASIFFCGASVGLLHAYRHHLKLSAVPWIWASAAMIFVGAVGYQQREEIFAFAMLEREPVVIEDTASLRSEVMLMRAWDGHFRAVAEISGQPVGLLVDTGASIVLIRYDDARRIGMSDRELNYNMPVTTASGRSFVAPVTFDRIEIGGIVVHNVKGAVAQPGELHTSLLGMSFIEQLHEAVFRTDRLILRY